MPSESGQSILDGPISELIPIPIHKAFEKIATSKVTEDVALIFEENNGTRKLSYYELEILTNRLARLICQSISENNLTKNNDGDYVIAVSIHPSDYLVVTLLAILKAGAAYLPLDPSFPKQRVAHILGEAKPTMIIFDEDVGNFANTFKLSFTHLLNNCSNISSKPIESMECLNSSDDGIAIILYTSGSTGVPKGVRLSHKNVLNRLQWQFKTFPYSQTETTCVFKTALTFVDSVSEIWGPLLNGLAVLVIPKSVTQNPEKLVNVLEKYKIERFVLVPSLLRALLTYFQLDNTKKHLPHLKTWVCSGEILPKPLVVDFCRYFRNNEYCLCNFYGSTEIMGDVTYYIIRNLEQLDHIDKVPIGLPIDNTKIYLLDSNFQPVKSGSVGELFVAGLNLAAGYVNGRDPEKFLNNSLTKDSNYSKLYSTGDFARIENGTLFYEGRTDSQIKIRGHRVDTSEVENAVKAVEGVNEAVVLCDKLGEPEQTLLAFVVGDPLLKEDEVESILYKTLISYMVPRVILVDAIPLLANGKIDRKLLLKDYEDFSAAKDGLQYRDDLFDFTDVCKGKIETAKILFESIASVLNKPTKTLMSINTNFYDIGGTSMNSISTITTLKSKGYHISIEDFITAKNLGEVLDRMTSETESIAPPLVSKPPYSTELLSEKYKEIIKEMVHTSFNGKSDLGPWLNETSSILLVEKLWPFLMRPEYSELSFIVKNSNGNTAGVALNFDASAEPEIEIDQPNMIMIFEFLDSVEKPAREMYSPIKKGQILHSFTMATHSSLTSIENVAVMRYMEEMILQIAKDQNFERILTTNTNPLTQQLGSDYFSYETISKVQANQYIATDGTRPFSTAADSWVVLVQAKTVI